MRLSVINTCLYFLMYTTTTTFISQRFKPKQEKTRNEKQVDFDIVPQTDKGN